MQTFFSYVWEICKILYIYDKVHVYGIDNILCYKQYTYTYNKTKHILYTESLETYFGTIVVNVGKLYLK